MSLINDVDIGRPHERMQVRARDSQIVALKADLDLLKEKVSSHYLAAIPSMQVYMHCVPAFTNKRI
jgi:hypothetical protein